MSRSAPRKHAISLEAEQCLITASQKGSQRATSMLVALDLPFIRGLARRLARHIIHKRDVESDVEDMVSAGLVEFVRKIGKYDKARSNGCRLRNYAFLDMKLAMNRTACDGLESVRLPREKKVHKAHRDFEAGMSHEELRKRYPTIHPEVLRSLHRSTVSLEQMREDEELGEEAESVPDASAVERLWPRLTEEQRQVIAARWLGLTARERAGLLGSPTMQFLKRERVVLEEIARVAKKLDDEPEVDPLVCGFESRVWGRLEAHERRVLSSLRLLWNRPLELRAGVLGVSPAEVRPIERAVLLRVREMCC